MDLTRSGKPVTHGGAGTGYSNHGCRCAECTEANTRRLKRRRAERKAEEPLTHGSVSTYVNWSCRCEKCGEAHNENERRARASRVKRGLGGENDSRHGTTYGYISWGCRCVRCREAHAAHWQRLTGR